MRRSAIGGLGGALSQWGESGACLPLICISRLLSCPSLRKPYLASPGTASGSSLHGFLRVLYMSHTCWGCIRCGGNTLWEPGGKGRVPERVRTGGGGKEVVAEVADRTCSAWCAGTGPAGYCPPSHAPSYTSSFPAGAGGWPTPERASATPDTPAWVGSPPHRLAPKAQPLPPVTIAPPRGKAPKAQRKRSRRKTAILYAVSNPGPRIAAGLHPMKVVHPAFRLCRSRRGGLYFSLYFLYSLYFSLSTCIRMQHMQDLRSIPSCLQGRPEPPLPRGTPSVPM
jgi:hypothetical protein